MAKMATATRSATQEFEARVREHQGGRHAHRRRTMDGRFVVSLVFVRKDGEWKLLHGHYSAPVGM